MIKSILLFFSLGDPPLDEQPSFSTIPIPTMYLNKGDTIIAGCSSDRAIDSIPIAWAFENNTEILFTGFDIPLFDIPLSLYGRTNLLVNSTEYDYHNETYLCQLLLLSGGHFLSAPVTFFVYGKHDKETRILKVVHGQFIIFKGLSTTFEASMNVLQHRVTYVSLSQLFINIYVLALKLPTKCFLLILYRHKAHTHNSLV